MSTDNLSDLWLLWRRTQEVVRAAVLTGVTANVGVAEADLGVLIHLSKAGGRLRQNALAAQLAWDRTRLSHLLTRMESRGQVTRTKLTNGAEIRLTDTGRALLDAAAPHLEHASRRQIGDRLGAEDTATLARILHRLLQEP